MFKPFVAILLFFCAKCTAQEVFYNRTCMSYDATVVQNFNLTKITGDWYELYRYFHKYEHNWDCVIVKYTSISEHEIKMTISGKDLNTRMEYDAWEANIYEKYPQYHEGYWIVETSGANSTVPFLVIGTDYTNYAVIWTCEDTANNNKQLLWILSRTVELDSNSQFEIAKVLENNHLNSTRLLHVVSNPKICGYKDTFTPPKQSKQHG